MTGGAAGSLKALHEEYTELSFIPDIAHYRRIQGQKSGHCIFLGCTEPIAWEDARGGNFLCEGHYLTVRRWVEDARLGIMPDRRLDAGR